MGKKADRMAVNTMESWLDGYQNGRLDAEWDVSTLWMSIVGGVAVTEEWSRHASPDDVQAVRTLVEAQIAARGKIPKGIDTSRRVV